MLVTKKGHLNGYGTVCYHPDRIASILSLSNVQKNYKVPYDGSQKTSFVVHKVECTNNVFMPSRKRLFFSDVKGDVAQVLFNTVDRIKNKYTVKKYSDTCRARIIQDII